MDDKYKIVYDYYDRFIMLGVVEGSTNPLLMTINRENFLSFRKV